MRENFGLKAREREIEQDCMRMQYKLLHSNTSFFFSANERQTAEKKKLHESEWKEKKN